MEIVNLLAGRSILIVEDDPLIAWHLAELFADGGAQTLSARACKQALQITQTEHLSAAVLDYACGDDNQTAILCDHLVKRQVPFMFYTGYDEVDEAHRTVLLVRKPASSEVLLRALMQLLLPSRSHLKALSRRC
jgi:CheY-like chemotaxis protein